MPPAGTGTHRQLPPAPKRQSRNCEKAQVVWQEATQRAAAAASTRRPAEGRWVARDPLSAARGRREKAGRGAAAPSPGR